MFKVLDIPWWYFIIAAGIGIIIGLWKKPALGILAGYAFLLLAETVLIRKSFVGNHFQPAPFWSWRAWEKQRNQILTNVVMFIPVGVLAGHLWEWNGLLFGAGLSLSVEILQLVSGRGLCELDDVVHNLLGVAIGIGLLMIARILLGKSEKKNETRKNNTSS